MNWKKAFLGDSTKYSFLNRDEVEDHRITYYLVVVNYFLVWVLWGCLFLFGYEFKYWMGFLFLGHLYIIALLLMKLNNFAFMCMNTYLKERDNPKNKK